MCLDLIVNSGATMTAVVQTLKKNVRRAVAREVPVMVVSPFATTIGIKSILRNSRDVGVHTLWHQMKIGANKRLVGIKFDAGDYALGGASERRLAWLT